jgi:hypothetical protein
MKTKQPQPALGEIKGAVERLLAALEVDKAAVRMGNTQVRAYFLSSARHLASWTPPPDSRSPLDD